MNQTTWIIGGGAVLLLAAALLFVFTGKGTAPTSNTTSNETVTKINEEKQETSVSNDKPQSNSNAMTASTYSQATIRTSKGDISLKLYGAVAPKTVENFAKLANSGFYNKVKFHRVIKGFMIQGGDPLSKDDTKQMSWGTGGPGYQFEDEIDPKNEVYRKGYKRGVLAMANAGPNTNGSQFFIMHQDYPLPPNYTIFGEVITGLEVVDAIANTATDANDRPTTPVVMEQISVK